MIHRYWRGGIVVEASCGRCGLMHPATKPCAALSLVPAWGSLVQPTGMLGAGYLLVQPIHQSGMSTVYLAEETARSRQVVIKELRLAADMTPAERQEAETWFLREATLLSTLRHPLIPRFHRAVNEDGRHYLVQEFVQGETLERLIRRQG